MAAGPWILTDHAKVAVVTDMQLATDTFNAILLASTSNISEASTTTYAGVTGELSTANGYTSGGQAVTVTVTDVGSGVIMIDETTNPSWTATGGALTARFCAIRNVTTGDILCFCLLDNTPADVTAPDGNPIGVTQNANGVARITWS